MSLRSRRFDIGADCRKSSCVVHVIQVTSSPLEKGRCKVYGTGVERLGFGNLLEFWGLAVWGEQSGS